MMFEEINSSALSRWYRSLTPCANAFRVSHANHLTSALDEYDGDFTRFCRNCPAFKPDSVSESFQATSLP
jgi:hypothetical protein